MPLAPEPQCPGGRVRCLYAGTVNAVALYGAPVWADRVMVTRQGHDALHSTPSGRPDGPRI